MVTGHVFAEVKRIFKYLYIEFTKRFSVIEIQSELKHLQRCKTFVIRLTKAAKLHCNINLVIVACILGHASASS